MSTGKPGEWQGKERKDLWAEELAATKAEVGETLCRALGTASSRVAGVLGGGPGGTGRARLWRASGVTAGEE